MKHSESYLQQSCVKWFNLQYPQYNGILVKIANEAKRTMKAIKGKQVCIGGVKWKAEGGIKGAADMCLFVRNNTYNCLFIEFKYGKNKQTEEQKEFQRKVELFGNKYILIYSFNEFVNVIKNYLGN